MKKKIINIEKFLEFTSGDPDSRRDMIALFLEQSMVYMQEMLAAQEADDQEMWVDTAHKFKGMAGFAGAEVLRELCLLAQDSYPETVEGRQKLLLEMEEQVGLANDFFSHYVKGL